MRYFSAMYKFFCKAMSSLTMPRSRAPDRALALLPMVSAAGSANALLFRWVLPGAAEVRLKLPGSKELFRISVDSTLARLTAPFQNPGSGEVLVTNESGVPLAYCRIGATDQPPRSAFVTRL